jgi:hypothetical protein
MQRHSRRSRSVGSTRRRRNSSSPRSPTNIRGAFLDFLGHDQNFLRLMQREALGDGSRVAEFFGQAVDEALVALAPAAAKAGISPQRLVLDLTALCWYPFAHEHTLLPALGMKARDPAFLDEQTRHLGDLVRAMTRHGRQRSRRQRS